MTEGIKIGDRDMADLVSHLRLGRVRQVETIPARQGLVFHVQSNIGDFALKIVTEEERRAVRQQTDIEVRAFLAGVPTAEPIQLGPDAFLRTVHLAGKQLTAKVNVWTDRNWRRSNKSSARVKWM